MPRRDSTRVPEGTQVGIPSAHRRYPQTLGGAGFRTTPEIHLSRGGANGTLIYNISLNKRSNHLTGSSGGSLCGMSDLGGRRIHPVVSEEMEGIGRLMVG